MCQEYKFGHPDATHINAAPLPEVGAVMHPGSARMNKCCCLEPSIPNTLALHNPASHRSRFCKNVVLAVAERSVAMQAASPLEPMQPEILTQSTSVAAALPAWPQRQTRKLRAHRPPNAWPYLHFTSHTGVEPAAGFVTKALSFHGQAAMSGGWTSKTAFQALRILRLGRLMLLQNQGQVPIWQPTLKRPSAQQLRRRPTAKPINRSGHSASQSSSTHQAAQQQHTASSRSSDKTSTDKLKSHAALPSNLDASNQPLQPRSRSLTYQHQAPPDITANRQQGSTSSPSPASASLSGSSGWDIGHGWDIPEGSDAAGLQLTGQLAGMPANLARPGDGQHWQRRRGVAGPLVQLSDESFCWACMINTGSAPSPSSYTQSSPQLASSRPAKKQQQCFHGVDLASQQQHNIDSSSASVAPTGQRRRRSWASTVASRVPGSVAKHKGTTAAGPGQAVAWVRARVPAMPDLTAGGHRPLVFRVNKLLAGPMQPFCVLPVSKRTQAAKLAHALIGFLTQVQSTYGASPVLPSALTNSTHPGPDARREASSPSSSVPVSPSLRPQPVLSGDMASSSSSVQGSRDRARLVALDSYGPQAALVTLQALLVARQKLRASGRDLSVILQSAPRETVEGDTTVINRFVVLECAPGKPALIMPSSFKTLGWRTPPAGSTSRPRRQRDP